MRLTLLLAGWLGMQWTVFPADPLAQLAQSIQVKTDDGAVIHCLVAGPQNSALAPMLFVPGYLMPADIFEWQVRHFAKDRRVVAMDPRSQGDSARVSYGHSPARRAKDIKAVADRLALKKFVLIGWSLAVLEELSFCEQFSAENLEALVFIDGDLSYEVPETDAAGQIQFLKAVASASQTDRPAALRAFVRGMYQNPPPPDHLARVTASVLATSEDTSLALLVNRIGFKFRPGLDKITLPVLVIVSEHNPGKDKILVEAKQMPNAEVHLMKEAGHALFVDQPEAFNQLLEEFLRRITATGAAAADHAPDGDK